MTTWNIQTRQFLLPKSGHQLSECEDAVGVNTKDLRFAVADGATEAFDAQSWARRLATTWVQTKPAVLAAEEFLTWVTEQGQRLHHSWRDLRLSWYAEEKARTGSYAAFIGVQLKLEVEAPYWRAIALGDACLIQCRKATILKALPVSDYQCFNSTPLLVPSQPAMQEATFNRLVIDSGPIEHQDTLLLLSDAVAAWYLMLMEEDNRTCSYFDLLLKEQRDGLLAELFEGERVAGRIKDDDIAVIRIEVQQQ